MAKAALLVVFNHRYDKNIPVLDAMLRERFPDIYYIVPFYDGDRDDVIAVYGRSIFFEIYLAQALNALRDKHYDHYIIMADDMVLNPAINSGNYKEMLSIEDGQSFIPMLRPLHLMPCFWVGTMSALTYSPRQKYVEAEHELPTVDEAMDRMRRQGVEIRPLTRRELFHDFTLAHHFLSDKIRLFLRVITRLAHPFRREYALKYPMVGSYSDFLVVAADDVRDFARYCGVFGATSLFVEVAVPTSLVLAARKKIQTEAAISLHGRSYWAIPENVFCEKESYTWENLEKEYTDLDDVIARFPEDAIYLHPIKLSKWLKRKK